MKRRRRLATAASLAFAAAGVAGCGSSSSGSSASSNTAATAPTISKSVFLAKANAICVKGNAASKAARARLGASPSEEQIVAFVRGTEVPAVQAQIDQIRALGAPAGDRARIKKMLDLAQQAVGRVRVVPTILTTGEDVFAPFAALAHPYGLTACAPNSAPSG
ncbi:MAG: hypothetical protein ACYDHT_04405 [Solirubrobacteraceae bacterium]